MTSRKVVVILKKKKRVVVTTCEAFRLASLYDYEVYSMNYENGFG